MQHVRCLVRVWSSKLSIRSSNAATSTITLKQFLALDVKRGDLVSLNIIFNAKSLLCACCAFALHGLRGVREFDEVTLFYDENSMK